MSDYTPTIKEVRQLYVDATRELLIRDMYLEEIEAEFDRWLAEVKAQERQAERDRIVEILEGFTYESGTLEEELEDIVDVIDNGWADEGAS